MFCDMAGIRSHHNVTRGGHTVLMTRWSYHREGVAVIYFRGQFSHCAITRQGSEFKWCLDTKVIFETKFRCLSHIDGSEMTPVFLSDVSTWLILEDTVPTGCCAVN